jgi:hypothetical protein
MRQNYWKRLSRAFLVFAVLGVVSSIPTIASATCLTSQQSCSTTYGVSQTQFDSGSVNQCLLHTGSSYCANVTAGDLGVGNGKGTAYQSQAGSGFTTNREPFISLSIGGVSTYLGYLSTASTSTTTANFTIETYLAHGYIVQSVGNPPTDTSPGHHILTPLSTTPTASSPGTEQFGMNLADTVPNGTCAVSGFCNTGTIASNYATLHKYYYPGSGSNYTDTLVTGSMSTGQTQYTVTYIYNIGNTTPDGLYTFNQSIVATSTY